MKRLSLRVVAALFTFAFGIYASALWVSGLGQTVQVAPPPMPPVVAAPPSERPTLEMVFVIDTTGSMGGLIEGAKQRVWGIINEAMQSSSKPSVRVGLVAYRDLGDEYVTQVLPLTDDLDKSTRP
ncbi:MAG TPA: VWA domain-containing protein [Pyrinomonadaceae bacterium]|nr:VWA domain-containing protein [Pyrinomonadaceae bacterium]